MFPVLMNDLYACEVGLEYIAFLMLLLCFKLKCHKYILEEGTLLFWGAVDTITCATVLRFLCDSIILIQRCMFSNA